VVTKVQLGPTLRSTAAESNERIKSFIPRSRRIMVIGETAGGDG
jgi:hypothetical protein